MEKIPRQHLEFLELYYPKIRAWVLKNEELRQSCDAGHPHYTPRLMQVGFEDFLALEEWL